MSSVERVAARESFSPDEPLPAFTFPILDEATKQEVLRRVDEARAAAGKEPLPPPAEAAATKLEISPHVAEPQVAVAATKLEISPHVAEPHSAVVEEPRPPPVEPPRRWLDQASNFIDDHRARLPRGIRRPLRRVRAEVILLALAILAAGILVGIIWFASSGDGGAEDPGVDPSAFGPAPEPYDPVPAELEEAKQQGHAALEKLAERFPEDHRVRLAIASAHFAEGRHAEATAAVAQALEAHPEAKDASIASEVLSQAVRKPGTTDGALELLQGPMGSAGATVVYDLSVDPKVELPLRARAEKWVRSEKFQKVALPDVELAGALRYAKSCSDRHELLPRAGEQGERRVLDFLHVAKVPAGCGSGARKDCYPCLRKDNALIDAITAIEKRLAAK
jgi:predicted negative regulator of RcsB-dependent stress response